LLIEEGRTNICLQSENFGTTWINDSGAVTITTNVEVSPDGSTTADKIAESASTTNRRICIQGLSVTSGTTYSYSCYIKAGERDFAQMATGTGLNSAFQNFIVNGANAGTLGSSSGIVSSRIDAMPNGWYRCTIVVTAIATGNTQVTVGPAPSSTITRWQAYSSTAGSGIYTWGAQLEAGSFPTSYIPTTTGTLARSADLCNITGANFTSFYNQSEGTLFADVSGLMTGVLGGNRGFALITDGTYANAFGILKSANVGFIRAEGNTGSVSQFSLTNAYAPFTQYKVALGVRTNDTNAAFNGSLKTTDTSVTLPSTMNRLEFRDATGAAGGQPSCHLAAVRYYKKRLPDAKLQALTV
jgi:hypothetical protein